MSCITRKPLFCLLDLPYSLCSNQSDQKVLDAGIYPKQSDVGIDANQYNPID